MVRQQTDFKLLHLEGTESNTVPINYLIWRWSVPQQCDVILIRWIQQNKLKRLCCVSSLNFPCFLFRSHLLEPLRKNCTDCSAKSSCELSSVYHSMHQKWESIQACVGETPLQHLSCLHCTVQDLKYWTLPKCDWLLLATAAIGHMLSWIRMAQNWWVLTGFSFMHW